MLHFETYQGLRVVYDDRDLPDYRQQLLTLLRQRTYKATWERSNKKTWVDYLFLKEKPHASLLP